MRYDKYERLVGINSECNNKDELHHFTSGNVALLKKSNTDNSVLSLMGEFSMQLYGDCLAIHHVNFPTASLICLHYLRYESHDLIN